MEIANLYKLVPQIIIALGIIGGAVAGWLVYSGLTTPTEKIQTRIRFRRGIAARKNNIKSVIVQSDLEELFKRAGNPLGLNASKYILIGSIGMGVLMIYYLIIPLLFGGSPSIVSMIIILALFVLISPNVPFSLIRYILQKLENLRRAKINSEIFTFHDLLIGELEMMTVSRVNTYNIIRGLMPYFNELKPFIRQLLSQWGEIGPAAALDQFAKEIDSTEAKALVTVLKNLDSNERETAVKGLKGMNDLFMRSQIENYRRRRKLTVDLASMPINSTVFIIIFNFVMIVVYMVMNILETSKI